MLARFDAAWAAMEGRLTSAIRLPDPAISTPATTLHDALFDEGLSFLVGEALTKHTESNRRLCRIAEDALRDDLESIVGRAFLDAVKREHQALGEAIGTKRDNPRVQPNAIAEGLAEVQYAIWWYGFQLLCATDFTSAESVDALRKALRPIDDYRAAHPYKGSEPPEAEGPAVTPTPALPPVSA